MYAPAHTTKIGWHVERPTIKYERRARSPIYEWGPQTQQCYTGYSNKRPTIKSDGSAPTPYYRKIGRLLNGGSFHLLSPSHEVRGDDSRVAFSLYGLPYGTSYANAIVQPPAWMKNQVIQQCMQRLMDVRANLMEDFAQAKRTMSMISQIFGLIVKLYLIARKGQWRKLRRLLRGMGHRPAKKAANGWLMYYYGIRPLVSTIGTLCASGGPRQKIASERAKVTSNLDPSPFVTGYQVVVSGEAGWRSQCGMTVGLNIDSSLAYWSTLGFTQNFADDALVTAWALLPYSFVIDWILPVERFLRTRRFQSGIAFHHGYLSNTLYCNGQATGKMAGLVTSPIDGVAVAKVKCLLFQRETYAFTPPSGLALNLSLTPTNLINAAALLIQRR